MIQKIHEINVQWPWLKILLLIMLVLGVFAGVMGGLQKEVAERTSEAAAVKIEEAPTELLGPKAVGVKGYEEFKELQEQEKEAPKEPEPEKEKPQTGGAEAEALVTTPPANDAPSNSVPPNPVPSTPGRKVVALTFDDGPSVATTPRLLDILAAKRAKATFFVLGYMAQRAPEVLKRQVAEGHEVESHTMSHQNLISLSGAAIQGEVQSADVVLQQAIGRPARLVRPPYGAINDTVRMNVGKPMIIWTVDPEDWKYRNSATVRANVVSRVFDGAIVLMHDIYDSTVDAVAGVIDDLRAAGYEFLTVEEMAAERGYVLQKGYSYGSF